MQENDKPVIQDFPKFSMFTDTPNNPGLRSKLVWSTRDGNPRVSVFTNDPTDKTNKGVIYCPMNPETFYSTMDILDQVIKSPEPATYKLDCLVPKRDGDNKIIPNERNLMSEFCFGKDDKGMVWLACIAPNRPKIKFVFRISDYHRIHKNNTPLTEAEASCIQASSTVQIIRHVMYPFISVVRPYNGSTVKPVKEIATFTSSSTESGDIPF